MATIDCPSVLRDSPVAVAQDAFQAVQPGSPQLHLMGRLRRHAFQELFIEELGWEYASGSWTIRERDTDFVLKAIAHKRGFQAFVCTADRFTLIDRYRLRAIQKQVAKGVHEHIVIYESDGPPRQVWQWGLRLDDGKRFRHLEHPFFSESPPPRLLARLDRLRFALDEEEAVTLVDAVSRVREVLGDDPEYALFAKRPQYARKSDELARAMATGGTKEFQEFVEFHIGLIRFLAKRCYRSLHIDLDEAEQLCALGVMRAAKLYDPNRGFQFATYASKSAKRVARRLAADVRFLVRLPQYVLPTCFASHRLLNDTLVAEGPQRAREAVEVMLDGVQKPVTQAVGVFEGMLAYESLADSREPASKHVRSLVSSEPWPETPMLRRETIDLLHQLIDALGERERTMVRLYHGFDGEACTLQEIGDRFGVTRERVRQILEQAVAKIRSGLNCEPEELSGVLS